MLAALHVFSGCNSAYAFVRNGKYDNDSPCGNLPPHIAKLSHVPGVELLEAVADLLGEVATSPGGES